MKTAHDAEGRELARWLTDEQARVREHGYGQTDDEPSYFEALRVIKLLQLQRENRPALKTEKLLRAIELRGQRWERWLKQLRGQQRQRWLRRLSQRRGATVAAFFAKASIIERVRRDEHGAPFIYPESTYAIAITITTLHNVLDRVRQCPICRGWFFARREKQLWCQQKNKPYRYHLKRSPKRGAKTIRHEATVLCGQRAYRALTRRGWKEWVKYMATYRDKRNKGGR